MNYANGGIPFWNSRSQPVQKRIAAMQQIFCDLSCPASHARSCCNATSLRKRLPDRTSPNFGKHHEDRIMKSFELAGEAMLRSAEGNRLIAQVLWNGLRALGARAARVAGTVLSSASGPHPQP
jgi:hypothetical protein